jgi:P-type Mg2+ transporter
VRASRLSGTPNHEPRAMNDETKHLLNGRNGNRNNDASYFGAIAKDIVGTRPLTSFDIGINRVSWMLIRFLLLMTPLVFLFNAVTKGDLLESLLFSVSVAVGLTPEMLPMVVTANLAKGAVMMARSTN